MDPPVKKRKNKNKAAQAPAVRPTAPKTKPAPVNNKGAQQQQQQQKKKKKKAVQPQASAGGFGGAAAAAAAAAPAPAKLVVSFVNDDAVRRQKEMQKQKQAAALRSLKQQTANAQAARSGIVARVSAGKGKRWRDVTLAHRPRSCHPVLCCVYMAARQAAPACEDGLSLAGGGEGGADPCARHCVCLFVRVAFRKDSGSLNCSAFSLFFSQQARNVRAQQRRGGFPVEAVRPGCVG